MPVATRVIATPQAPSNDRLWRWAGLALAAAVVLMFFCQLSYRLIDPDESRYALIARDMLDSGNWLVPMRAGEPYLDKPPMLYWLTAAVFWLAGPSDAMARMVPALAAAGTCLVTYMLGKRLVGNRAALLGTTLLLLSVGFVMAGRFLLMDGLLTLFVMSSVLSMYIATSGDRVRWSWWLVGAATCGLAVLTKGPVGVVLCVPPLVASHWLTQQNRAKLRAVHWATFASVVAAIALPWFVVVSVRHPEFMSYFLWQHHVMRFMGSFHHEQSWWFYIPTIIIWMAPASLLMPFLVVFLFRRSESLYRARTQADGYLLLSAAWTLVFFSLSSGKLIAYVLPAVPPLCLLLGRTLAAAVFSEDPVRDRLFLRTREALAFHGARLGAIALAVTAMVNLVAGHSGYLGGESSWGQVANALLILVAAVGFALVTVAAIDRRQARLTLAVALFMLAIMSAIVDLVPKVAQQRSLAAQVASVRAEVAPTVPVVTFPRQEDGLEFYHTGGRLMSFEMGDYCQLVGFLERNRQTLIVATSDGAELLEERLPSWINIVEADGRGRIYFATVDEPAMRTANQHSDSTPR
jgi:dolichol-phosphate mannosyltransferase